MKSVDAFDIMNDATNLFNLFDEIIEWVGPNNVVHIVIDNVPIMCSSGDWFLRSIDTLISHLVQFIALI